MPLCTVALYGNTLLFKRRSAYAEKPRKIWGLKVLHLYTSASGLTQSLLKAFAAFYCSEIWPLSLSGGSLQWLLCVERTRVEEISSLNVLNSPTIFGPSPFTDLFSVGWSGPRHLPDAPMAASLQHSATTKESQLFTTEHMRGILL